MCEIQNEYMYIIIFMTLFIIIWNGGWMIDALGCHLEGKGFNSFLWYIVNISKPTYMLRGPTYLGLDFISPRIANKFKS